MGGPVCKDCTCWNRTKGNIVAMFRQPEQRFIRAAHDFGVAGFVVKMIIDAKKAENVTSSMITDAIRRLHEGFAFVGLTEDWNMSICLFHAMFGSSCQKRDFLDFRSPSKKPGQLFSTAKLKGWKDPYDGPLFAEVVSIYKENLKVYGVNRSTCRTIICP